MPEDVDSRSAADGLDAVERAREILALAEALAAADPTEREEHSAALLAVAAEVAPALESLCTTDPEAALRLAGATSMFWQDAGLVDEGRRVVDLALASARAGSDRRSSPDDPDRCGSCVPPGRSGDRDQTLH